MNRTWRIRTLSVFLLIAMLVPSVPGLADIVTSNGRWIQTYNSMDADDPTNYTARVAEQEVDPPVNGWYKVRAAGTVYVKAGDVSVVDATPTPVPAATATPTLAPGVTASPTPDLITGETDASYEGTVLSYKVPVGGLWLYDLPSGKAVESVSYGVTVKLTVDSVAGWYNTYYGGTKYYVPASILSFTADTTNIAQTASIVLLNQANLYSQPNTNAQYKTDNTLEPGVRVNASYYNTTWYRYNLGGTNYYILRTDVDEGQNSTATVDANESVTLMRLITAHDPNNTGVIWLFRTKEQNADYYVLNLPASGTYNFYGIKVDTDWYKVMYGGETFYLLATNITTEEQIAVSATESNSTYLITIGGNGAYLYSKPTRTENNKPLGSVGTLPAGISVLASPYQGTAWYTYSKNSTVYYIHGNDLNTATSTSNLGSLKVYLANTTDLYDKMTATNPTSVTLPTSDFYVVKSVNDEWYSIVYDGVIYYIKKASGSTGATGTWITVNSPVYLYNSITGANEGWSPLTMKVEAVPLSLPPVPAPGYSWAYLTTISGVDYLLADVELQTNVYNEFDVEDGSLIANAADGKSYYVTIGIGGATLFTDAGCTTTTTPPVTLAAGEIVYALKYTDSLYTVQSGGATYYLPVRYISSIKGGDDASATTTVPGEESISDIVKGETNTGFANQVMSYVIPAGGVWLYRTAGDFTTKALSLNYGTTIYISESTTSGWYTTWYGGSQYYIPASALAVTDQSAATGASYSVVLSANVDLYTSTLLTAATKASPTITLTAGTRINVRVQSKKTVSGVSVPAVYAYTHFDNKTYYFSADGTTVAGSMSAAQVNSNVNTSFITKLELDTADGYSNIKLYSAPNTSSGSVTVSFASENKILYGVNYDSDWYKVIYNDAAWYMRKGDYLGSAEQMSISGSASSTTYTVTIGANGAVLYSLPSSITANNTGTTLAAGQQVLASSYGTGWYAYADPTTGVTRYFLASAIATTNSNATLSSYVITLGGSQTISVYSTVSATASPVSSTQLNAGGTYTLRWLNATWSSVVLNNRTYYVKNADIPTAVMDSSVSTPTTSVGKSYKITIGATGADVFSNTKLTTSLKIGTLAPGYTTTGTKMYEASAANGSAPANQHYIYAISYGGKVSYISANDVAGIGEGDEVWEAQQAEQEANKGSNIAVGTSMLETLNAGTLLYASQSTSASTVSMPSTMILSVTKVSSEWYSTTYNGSVYYIPATVIEPESSSGTTGTQVTVSVGESYTLTFTQAAWVYDEAEDWATYSEVILTGETHIITKISDKWYEVTYNGKKMYLKVTDVVLPIISSGTGTGNTNTNVTHDGTGYVTALLSVSVSSGSLNLRKEATTGSTVLDKIPNGTQVTNHGYVVDSSNRVWYKVTYKTRTGYILGDFVKPVGTASGGTSVDPSQDIGKSFAVNTSSVNIRSGPGTSYSTVGRLEKGTMVTPIDYTTGADNLIWYKFKYTSSVTAYIRSDYLAGTAASTMEQSGNVAIRQGDTNMRSGPGDGFGVVTKLARDTIVTIVGTGTDSNENLWYRVTVGNQSGYVRYDLVRALTTAEQNSLLDAVAASYTELTSGSKGQEVINLQNQLIRLGYLTGTADGQYGSKTIAAVKAFQTAKGLSATGVATKYTQYLLFNQSAIASGSTQALDWFSAGYSLINANKSLTIYDINSGVTWSATYINGSNHADVIPASSADAAKLKANNITGSYVRRPVIVTISGTNYAGSMYAVGHGTTSYCSYFSGVMCIHFTGSKTHGTGNVDSDHQSAIQTALQYSN